MQGYSTSIATVIGFCCCLGAVLVIQCPDCLGTAAKDELFCMLARSLQGACCGAGCTCHVGCILASCRICCWLSGSHAGSCSLRICWGRSCRLRGPLGQCWVVLGLYTLDGAPSAQQSSDHCKLWEARWPQPLDPFGLQQRNCSKPVQQVAGMS